MLDRPRSTVGCSANGIRRSLLCLFCRLFLKVLPTTFPFTVAVCLNLTNCMDHQIPYTTLPQIYNVISVNHRLPLHVRRWGCAVCIVNMPRGKWSGVRIAERAKDFFFLLHDVQIRCGVLPDPYSMGPGVLSWG